MTDVEQIVMEGRTNNPDVINALTPTLKVMVSEVMNLVKAHANTDEISDLVLRTETATTLAPRLINALEMGGSLVANQSEPTSSSIEQGITAQEQVE